MNKLTTIFNVEPNFNSEREELLYALCLSNDDLLANIITEYITRLSDTDLTELDDYIAERLFEN